MLENDDRIIKRPPAFEFLTSEGCCAANIHEREKSVCGNLCISDGTVQQWVRSFRGEDPKNVRDCMHPGRPFNASDKAHPEAFDYMIKTNRRVRQMEFIIEAGISRRVPHSVTSLLGYRKFSAVGPYTLDFRNGSSEKRNVYPTLEV